MTFLNRYFEPRLQLEPVNTVPSERILYWSGYRINHQIAYADGGPTDPFHKPDEYRLTGRVEIGMWAQQSPPRFHEIHRTSDGRIIFERLDDGKTALLYGAGIISEQSSSARYRDDVAIWAGMPVVDPKLMLRDDLLRVGVVNENDAVVPDHVSIHEIGSVAAGSGSRRVRGESGHQYEEIWVHMGQMMEETYFPELPRIWVGEEGFDPFLMQAKEESVEVEIGGSTAPRDNANRRISTEEVLATIPFELWSPNGQMELIQEAYYQANQPTLDPREHTILENLEQVFQQVEYSEIIVMEPSTKNSLMIRQSPSDSIAPLLRQMIPSWIRSRNTQVAIANKERSAWFLYHPDTGGQIDPLNHMLFVEIDDQLLFIVGHGYSEEQLLEMLSTFQIVL